MTAGPPPASDIDMKLSKLPLAAAFGLLMIVLITSMAAGPASALEMNVEMRDTFTFVPDTIRVQPGEQVSLRIVNTGIATHTFTLFAQVNAQVPFDDFTELTAYNDSNAKLADVWLPGGEATWANFTAPTQEGSYVFVCMIAPHAQLGMRGVMVVTTQTGLDIVTIAIIAGVTIPVAIVAVIFVLRMRKR